MKLFRQSWISLILILAISISCSHKNNKELAKKILEDRTLDTVYFKATQLLKKGFTAGDGYPQVWIRDFH
jgi:hypothetical protein